MYHFLMMISRYEGIRRYLTEILVAKYTLECPLSLSIRAYFVRERNADQINNVLGKTVEYVFKNNVSIDMINIGRRNSLHFDEHVSHTIVRDKDNFY